MGQTLTHGIYLPDEGERNCYNGLAANWQLLDNSVGTIAEHTSQIAGKAPLVHTHTKADITDFPALATVATSGSYNDLSNIPASFTPASHTHGNLTNDGKVGTTANVPLITGTGGVVQAGSFGTAANTFCEGNDSRLSDARTPVAHTHVTADVTDLLNSAHEWTDTQTYSAASYGQKILLKNTGLDLSVSGNTGLSSTYQHVISWVDKNNTMYSSIQSWASDANNTLVLRSYYRTDANTSRNLSVRFVNTATDKSIYSETNADTNLGTSTNQWNNLYAKNYYYNGVEFQNKFATLDTVQTIPARKNLKDYWHLMAANLKAGAGEIYGRTGYSFIYTDKNDLEMGDVTLYKNSGAARTFVRIRGGDYYTNGVPDAEGTLIQSALLIGTKADSTRMIACVTDAMYPENNNATDLGTPTNKWKTLNGINPGSLSFPSGGTTENTDWFNVAGNILPAGGNATDFTGTPNYFTPSKDGWLALVVVNCSYISVWDSSNRMGQSLYVPDTTKNQQVLLPVLAGHLLEIRVIGSRWYSARLIMPQGNV